MTDVSYPIAVFYGLLSFLSPCVLPLVPAYLTYLAGESIDEIGTEGTRGVSQRALVTAGAFVLGFSTIFVLLGATASLLGQVLRDHARELSVVAGLLIITMGLHFLGVFRIGLLYREARFTANVTPGPVGAFVMGLAFAFGWTPCIGPVLGAILGIAGSADTLTKGATLLAAYSLGLGIPFLIAAFAMDPFIALMRRFRARLALVEKAMGTVLIATGVAFLTGGIERMALWLLEMFPALAKLG